MPLILWLKSPFEKKNISLFNIWSRRIIACVGLFVIGFKLGWLISDNL